MPPIDEVISLGVVPRLIEFLRYHDQPVSFYFVRIVILLLLIVTPFDKFTHSFIHLFIFYI